MAPCDAASLMSEYAPLPRMASTFASVGARSFVAAAETAAVRISVINRPSITTSGVPVSTLTTWSAPDRVKTRRGCFVRVSSPGPAVTALRETSVGSTTGPSSHTSWIASRGKGRRALLPPLGESVRRARGHARIEISGGVTLDRVCDLASTGADYASAGALTHSAPAADISFEIEPL